MESIGVHVKSPLSKFGTINIILYRGAGVILNPLSEVDQNNCFTKKTY
jgi:hypothetical protein